jgi:hypothetical protein
MSFKKYDRVKVTSVTHSQQGQVGAVDHVYSDETTFTVRMDNGNFHSFFKAELELVDAEREALIELAETLDKARQQANAIPAMAPQSGVYGDVSEALKRALAYEFGVWVANKIYASLLDGNTVREAIAAVEAK